MNARGVLLLLGAGAFVVQCVGLYGPPGPPSPSGIPLDKINHVIGFAVPVALFTLARVDWRIIAAAALAQAAASEIVQGMLLPERSGDPLDLLADVVGIGLGFGAAAAWIRSRSGPSSGRPRRRRRQRIRV